MIAEKRIDISQRWSWLGGVLGLRESGEEEEEAAEVGGRDLTLTAQGILLKQGTSLAKPWAGSPFYCAVGKIAVQIPPAWSKAGFLPSEQQGTRATMFLWGSG